MWADNEADLDLLGFDFLVDGLVVALTEPRLLPLTIGVLGDWGSGKSSLMRIAGKELPEFERREDSQEPNSERGYLTVAFSPWQYEDHEDVKIALMTAVLDEIANRVPTAAAQVGKLRSIVAGLKRWGRRLGRTGAAVVPTVLPVVLQAAAPDLDSGTTEVVSASTEVLAKAAQSALSEPDAEKHAAPKKETPTGDVNAFRREFEILLQEIPDCEAIVVFIDDLDRCLPETVVDTFEVIRLFLNTPKTAYVLALNQNVVESAIDSRYPELRKADGAGIGRDYLEKMLQLKIAIPPLAEPEAETYVNLLFAELHLPSEDFARVLDAAGENRRANGLAVGFNIGIAGTVLDGNIPTELAEDLRWAADISPVLGSSLRGNPRQLKRFLNNLLLKHRSAGRRGADLKLPVLAKLMVLEDQYNTDFQKLFDWEMAVGGACPEIVEAEARARGRTGDPEPSEAKSGEGPPHSKPPRTTASTPDSAPESREAQTWADKPHIADWLRVEPPFGGMDLRPYFTYSRDKLSFGVSASRLAPHLQRLLTDVQSDVDPVRRGHYAAIDMLPPNERIQFMEALLERVQRNPGSIALTAALELAEKIPEFVPIVCAVLIHIPPTTVPTAAGSMAVRRLPMKHADVVEVLDRWETGDNASLRTVVQQARQAATASRRASGGNLG